MTYLNANGTYNLSAIMSEAHRFNRVHNGGKRFGHALKMVWMEAKEERAKALRGPISETSEQNYWNAMAVAEATPIAMTALYRQRMDYARSINPYAAR